MRATLRLSSPAWLVAPKTTSPTASATVGLRARRALMQWAARSSARTLARPPRRRPMGVRSASRTKTLEVASDMAARTLPNTAAGAQPV
jgi:hypothetical protein